MSNSKFVTHRGEAQLFASVADANKANMLETIAMAVSYGFDALKQDGDTMICGHKGGASVTVFFDGGWEYGDAEDAGLSAVTLGWCLEGRAA